MNAKTLLLNKQVLKDDKKSDNAQKSSANSGLAQLGF
jgi:hypothetical protein